MKISAYLALVLAGLGAVSTASANGNDLPNLSNSEFQQCLNTLKNTAAFRGVSSATFEAYRPAQPDPSVIRSLNYQPEFKKDVWDYLASLVDSERVEDGIRAKREQADVLRRIESRYGVKPEHVLGVWGVESNFGQTLGKKNLFDSLATLSCFDRRQSYFRGEFANALKIVQNGDIRPQDMTGSWAGAFGQTQFMPSTFLELAVDFDGDGRKDLVNSKADALASTANFLVKRGYRSGEPWGYEVKLNGYDGSSGRRNKQPISHWRSQGITLPNGKPLPDNMASAGLLLPAGKNGPAFLVGKNFDTFYSYNASESYALAIAHLSDLITSENTNTDFATAWPTDDPGIGRREAKEIQQGLIDAGYDIGAVDGIIGDNTRRAIMDYQRKAGVNPDGRAGQKFHRLITSQGKQNSTPANNLGSTATKPSTITPSATSSTGTTYRRVINADGSASLVPVK
ncbi:lytic murein transglycosylase [Moraxella cuniculi DSM 21768]|uniref:Lytic murein transglycosylase n=1 Tax=Moraxella cuniculi DSM 21768 TaxID=1122245 RepID=A0A1N7EC19_9GAMM|nr:lytic murein transglycosylase [Moraxella cuniculi]OOS05372.1 lytic transglycosylase [Moraxella cuniculi]SIR85528.1 lytic murein transglycosylase [Moraxella cuniculi DSM 21768]